MMTGSVAAVLTASGLMPPGRLGAGTGWLGFTYSCSLVRTCTHKHNQGRENTNFWVFLLKKKVTGEPKQQIHTLPAVILNSAHLVSWFADDGPREEDDVVLTLVLWLSARHSEQHEVLHRLSCHLDEIWTKSWNGTCWARDADAECNGEKLRGGARAKLQHVHARALYCAHVKHY